MTFLEWFRGPRREPELHPDLIKRLDALEDANRRTEKAMKALELDWGEWFDKFRLLYARLSKRIRDATPPAEEPAPEDQSAPPTPMIPRAVSYDRPHFPQTGTRRNY